MRQFIFTRNFPLKPRLTYFPRRPGTAPRFSGIRARPARVAFSSPPLGFYSVRIRCTTYTIHLVMWRVLWHITYSYLAYQPNQAPSVFIRLAKRTFDSTRLLLIQCRTTLVGEVGLEPTRSLDQGILSPLWLPLHHSPISRQFTYAYPNFRDVYIARCIAHASRL